MREVTIDQFQESPANNRLADLSKQALRLLEKFAPDASPERRILTAIVSAVAIEIDDLYARLDALRDQRVGSDHTQIDPIVEGIQESKRGRE